ncbi:enoyl-CoA hydratase/isomerase family protein [Orrella sp. 11846]|uniref:enoyl-CoA hydratase/isomerase family protein n=1 Tax=Orrella sp. 11846 TaxID=3409913 RepID=UPI003B59C162
MSEVIYSQTDAIARITLNRPEQKNTVSATMRSELIRLFDQVNEDTSVRAVVLEAAGDTFCAGGDVSQMGKLSSFDDRKRILLHSHGLIKSLYRLEKPVIAAVQGAAVGMGFSLVLACDFVIASESARFSTIFSRRGLAPDTGSAYMLSRAVSPMKARDLLYSGRFVGAQEALALDLVTEVVPEALLKQSVDALAEKYAAMPTLSVAMSKKLLQWSQEPALDSFLNYEAFIQPLMRTTEDFQEGVASFREKRSPEFKGR